MFMASRDEVRQISGQLCRALRARAAQGSAVLIAHDRRAADGAAVRQAVRHGVRRALCGNDLQDLRDDLPCLADPDGVADADILVGDKVLVVERRGGDGRPGEMDRGHDRPRGQHARAPHLHDDILQHGLLDLRRVFEGRRPARELRRAAEPLAPGQTVELHDGSVDIIRQLIAGLAELGDQLLRFVHIAAERVRYDLEFERPQIVERFAVRPERDALCQLQVEDENVELPLCRHARVQLAQRARRGVARVSKQRLAELLLLGVERFKAGTGHEDLAAHDETRGRAGQRHGDGADGLQILRHVLTDEAVAAGRAADKAAVHVFQRHGQPVDLRLDGVFRVRLLLAHMRIEVPQLVKGKHVLQALQRDGVAYLDEFAQRLPADTACRAERRGILRVLCFQLLELAELVVIVIVAHLRVIEHVVEISGVLKFPGQLFDLLFRFHIDPNLLLW